MDESDLAVRQMGELGTISLGPLSEARPIQSFSYGQMLVEVILSLGQPGRPRVKPDWLQELHGDRWAQATGGGGHDHFFHRLPGTTKVYKLRLRSPSKDSQARQSLHYGPSVDTMTTWVRIGHVILVFENANAAAGQVVSMGLRCHGLARSESMSLF
ncbi:hypothetical protein NL676_026404 [Syzygium grande]|nr:hypothetical protein NL676_026404 [Syzygium grande]